jgi:hypothetical protein
MLTRRIAVWVEEFVPGEGGLAFGRLFCGRGRFEAHGTHDRDDLIDYAAQRTLRQLNQDLHRPAALRRDRGPAHLRRQHHRNRHRLRPPRPHSKAQADVRDQQRQSRPASSDDTFDLIDDALATIAARRSVWLGDDLSAMTLVASLIEQAERFLPQLVCDARANSHTWHEIAHAVGTSPDDAQLRFDPDSPIADSRWPYDS